MQRARAAGAVAEHDDDHAAVFFHLLGERDARRDADIAADHGVCAEEASGRFREMPASRAASIKARNLAQQFRHHAAGIDAARQSRPDRTAARQQLIAFIQNGGQADRDRFFARGQQLESVILAFGQRRLKRANAHHGAQGFMQVNYRGHAHLCG